MTNQSEQIDTAIDNPLDILGQDWWEGSKRDYQRAAIQQLIAREVEAALTATKTDATTELGRQIVKWKLMGVISRPNAPTQELLTGFKKVIDDRIAAIKGGENE